MISDQPLGMFPGARRSKKKSFRATGQETCVEKEFPWASITKKSAGQRLGSQPQWERQRQAGGKGCSTAPLG